MALETLYTTEVITNMKHIFISSTFKDMHYERDLFHSTIMPKLNGYINPYGDKISFCDLRRDICIENIDTEKDAKQILSACLDEIDLCDKSGSTPYMIVLLGNRYGWIPDHSLLKSVTWQKNFELKNRNSSITELEIEYGALRDTAHLKRTLFYFREFEEDPPKNSKYAVDGNTDEDRAEYKKRLKALKKKICRLPGSCVKTYQVHLADDGETLLGLDTFSDMVIEDIRNSMEKW